jgi:methionyl aminopeptidase
MTISSKEDVAGMCRVGQLVGLTLREMKAAARPGMTTAELDRIGAD